nr:O-glucosyltransferase rumi homolog [Onthophagus taurus]
MYFKSFLYIFFVVFINLVACSSDTCSKSNKSNCNLLKNENKYNKEINQNYKKYFEEISEAKKKYTPCETDKCKCYSNVINNDLKAFTSGITKNDIERVKSKGSKYQIINHKLYRDKDCMFPSRCLGIEHFLLNLLPHLPDMEFIINSRDWPQIHKDYGVFGPVFSFSKTNDYHDIMYPAWAFWEGGPAIELYPRGIGRWDLHREQLSKTANETSWESKIPKAFFRGSRTSSERDPLILLSREHPELIDAKYTKNQAWKSEGDTLHAPPAKEVSFEEHCKYKYLFNFRGVAASFRFKHILLCKSLVFHVGDEWQEFFYTALKPWIHYVPVKTTATKQDIWNLIEFFRENEDLAREISENGHKLIWNHLKMNDVKCYWSKLLKKYAKLLLFKPSLDLNLIEIKK